jgi:hypothetical protein
VQAAKQLLINAKALSADQLLFSKVGEVIVSETVRPLYVDGVNISLGNINVPTTFRLTRSIWSALSPTLVRGILSAAIGVVLDALEENKDVIDISLRFLFLYDLQELTRHGITSTSSTSSSPSISHNFDQVHSLLARTLAESAWQKSIFLHAPCHQTLHQHSVSIPQETKNSSSVTNSLSDIGEEQMEVLTPSVDIPTSTAPVSTSTFTPALTNHTTLWRSPIDSQILVLIDNSLKEDNIKLYMKQHDVFWVPQL